MPLPWFSAESGKWLFRSFTTSLVRASLSDLISSVLMRREAGENPALPRNCKRGNSQSVTGVTPGKAGCIRRTAKAVLTRKARRLARTVHTNPFRETKEECMRFFRILVSVICLLAAASAAEIKVKVVDPQSAVVVGAQVVLMLPGSTTPAAVGITSGEGLVVFREVGSGSFQVRVLAPGFAANTTDVSPSAEMVTVQLGLAPAAESVVVTA